MRRLTTALLASAAMITMAAPAMAQSAFDGPYVGAFAGYTDGDGKTRVGTANRDVGIDGFSFGGYAGFGRTFDRLYLGAEGEVGYTDVDGRGTLGTTTFGYNSDWTYGLSGRAGFLVTPDILAYGRVGYQWTEFDVTATSGATTVDLDRTFRGWRYGGGVEVALGEGLTTRVEYNYTDYKSYSPVTVGGSVARLDPREHSIRLGVGYSF